MLLSDWLEALFGFSNIPDPKEASLTIAKMTPNPLQEGDLYYNGSTLYFHDSSSSHDLLAGGSAPGISGPYTKTGLTNNAANPIYSFPLTNGQAIHLSNFIAVVGKGGSDTGMGFYDNSALFINNNGVLLSTDDGLQSDVKTTGAGVTESLSPQVSYSLSNNVVTVSVNPGNLGAPSSIVTTFMIINPYQVTITAL